MPKFWWILIWWSTQAIRQIEFAACLLHACTFLLYFLSARKGPVVGNAGREYFNNAMIRLAARIDRVPCVFISFPDYLGRWARFASLHKYWRIFIGGAPIRLIYYAKLISLPISGYTCVVLFRRVNKDTIKLYQAELLLYCT